jgi:cell division cycle protein 37
LIIEVFMSAEHVYFVCRIKVAEAEYKNSFDNELQSFKDRIRKRAAQKIQEALQEEEEEKKARLGPGGLDPVEVYESLPEVRAQV